MQAAAELFALHGYAGTTLSQVAQQAGVSLETVKSLGPKANLLRAAFESSFIGDERDPSRPPFELSSLDLSNSSVVARLLLPVVNGFAASSGIYQALESAAATEPEAAALREQLLTSQRDDLAGMLAAHGDVPPARRHGVTDELTFVVSHTAYGHFVLRCGWSADRYRRWAAERVAAILRAASR
ncbi:TetR/AcrR family transcriptional regulator [Flexivirga meconopsidis]|uniref:TetR/AcrR family transcriptional regulator n=1 Tax=Flexivirga meconopsidis TaxID=2977121 RepID=UPI00223EAEA4